MFLTKEIYFAKLAIRLFWQSIKLPKLKSQKKKLTSTRNTTRHMDATQGGHVNTSDWDDYYDRAYGPCRPSRAGHTRITGHGDRKLLR